MLLLMRGILEPILGILIAHLFSTVLLSALTVIISIYSLCFRKLPAIDLLMRIAIALLQNILFSGMIFCLIYMANYFNLYESYIDISISSGFFIIYLSGCADEIYMNSKKIFKQCTIPGQIDLDILKRKYNDIKRDE